MSTEAPPNPITITDRGEVKLLASLRLTDSSKSDFEDVCKKIRSRKVTPNARPYRPDQLHITVLFMTAKHLSEMLVDSSRSDREQIDHAGKALVAGARRFIEATNSEFGPANELRFSIGRAMIMGSPRKDTGSLALELKSLPTKSESTAHKLRKIRSSTIKAVSQTACSVAVNDAQPLSREQLMLARGIDSKTRQFKNPHLSLVYQTPKGRGASMEFADNTAINRFNRHIGSELPRYVSFEVPELE